MKGAELFVRCLENEGVEYVFGLPGEEVSELLKALASSKKIKFVLSRHEQAASFMADVYGRLTGKAGVCLSTLGPGATNLLTGVADAYLDRAPVVAITGQGGLERTYEESHQYIDVVSVYKFVTKWNRSITRAEFIPQVVRKAFDLAESEKTGAVHIELPEDIASDELVDGDGGASPLEMSQKPAPSVVSLEGARKAVSLIGRSTLPVILAGNGVIRASASRELYRFAKEFNIPVVNTFMGKGAISSREDLSLGTIGLQVRDLVNCVFEKSDLVITVGYDFVEYAPKFWNERNKRVVIHVDSAPSETDAYYTTALELVGDIRATLDLLAEEAKGNSRARKDCSYALNLRGMINEDLMKYANDDSFPVKPQRIVYELRKALSDDDVLVSDVGMHKLWIGRLYPAYSPNTVVISNGFASMGISLPGAIAAKLARPEKRVVAACGDGGFMMNVYDLETAKRLGLAFVVVVFNDGQYSQIDWKQRSKYGESFFVKFTNPDFVKLAESFGCRGARPRSVEEFGEVLSKALNSDDEVWVIDVPVDVEENLALSGRLGDNVECPPVSDVIG
jgi:acetolactate synthase-1/2/3 large subunit